MTARLLGISIQAFQNWGLDPDEEEGREKLYDWDRVRHAAERKKAELESPSRAEKKRSLSKVRLEHAKAVREEMRLEKDQLALRLSKKQLVERDRLAAFFTKLLTEIKEFAQSLADTVDQECSPGADVIETIDQVAFERLEAFSKRLREFEEE